MYINSGHDITNTPNHFTAAYNTWPYYTPPGDQYQHVTRYYIDQNGKAQEWNHWNPPRLIHVPGFQYKGTPTRTGSFFVQNTIVDPSGAQNYGYPCGWRR